MGMHAQIIVHKMLHNHNCNCLLVKVFLNFLTMNVQVVVNELISAFNGWQKRTGKYSWQKKTETAWWERQ